jgi:hypothetical protein
MKKERLSNLELLRIISMLLIIGYHLFQHSCDGALMYLPLGTGKISLILTGSWGIVGVDCLVILSAWFLCESKSFNSEKHIRLIVQTVFYSVLCYLIICIYQGGIISLKVIIKCIIGFAYDEYWYVTAFIILMVLSPILNFGIKRMTNIMLRNTAFIMLILFVVWEFFLWKSPVSTIELFVAIYITTAYLKRMQDSSFIYKYRNTLFVSCISFVVLFSIIVSILPQSLMTSSIIKYAYITLLAKYSPVMLLIAFSLFFIFKNLKIQNKNINYVSKHTFASYLIHENDFVYPVIWGGVNAIAYVDKSWFILYIVVCMIAIFMFTIVVDIMCFKLYEFLVRLICNLFNSQLKKINEFMQVYYD